ARGSGRPRPGRRRADRPGRARSDGVHGGPARAGRPARVPPLHGRAPARGAGVKALVWRALVYGRMIRFSHSVFALPFALASAAMAAGGRVPWRELPWIVVAMVGARSAAMGFNRLADQAIDARNPRTASRELPRGLLSRGEVWLFVLVSAAALVG